MTSKYLGQLAAGFCTGFVLFCHAVDPVPVVLDPAGMDRDGNGLPDIWESTVGGFGLDPAADNDGDGVSNLDESRAGTDPWDPKSALLLNMTNGSPTGFQLTWPILPMRSSSLMGAGSLTGESWVGEGGVPLQSNGFYSVTLPVGQSNRFYVVENADQDLDGDGVQDWIELSVGYSISNSESAMADRMVDTNGDQVPDTLLAGDLVAFNEVYNEASATNRPSGAQAARFLMQSTFGCTYSDITNLQAVGIDQWISDQMALPPSYTQPYIDSIRTDWANRKIGTTNLAVQGYASNGDIVFGNNFMSAWAQAAIQADDQLRQRVAFALSQILVVSRRDAGLANKPAAIANYYDQFIEYAFGNFEDLLTDVAFHACMGIYLSHLGNQKADVAINRYPDENFAREVMQLFTIGLWELNMDGTRKLDIHGEPIPTYGNQEITEMARVFTGLSWGGYSWPWGWNSDDNLQVPMDMNAEIHDFGSKTLLNGYEIPARAESDANGLLDITDALHHLFMHDNTAPFICRQLIQFLVTSNPSTDYVARISAVFVDNGSGVRGDLGAVVRAILLDPESRRPAEHLGAVQYGSLREPVIRTMHLARVQQLGRFSNLLWWDWGNFGDEALQEPMHSPSVFNYYRPDYRLPGQLAEGGWDSPAFGIMDSYSAISFPNRLWSQMKKGFQYADYDHPPDWAAFAPLVSDVPALVDRASLLFCGGDMTAETRDLIISSVSQLDEVTEQIERIRLALYLAMMSPEGSIRK